MSNEPQPKRDVYIVLIDGLTGSSNPKKLPRMWAVACADRKRRKGCRLNAATFDARDTSFEYVRNYVALRADLNLVSDVPAKQVIELHFAESPQGDNVLFSLEQNWPGHRFARYGWPIIHVLTPVTDEELRTMGRQAEIYLGRG